MRLPRVRLSVRRMMAITATLAVAFSVFLGIGPATLVIIGLGFVLGLIGVAISVNYGETSSIRSARVNALDTFCSVGMKILFEGFILGGLFYFLFALLFFALST